LPGLRVRRPVFHRDSAENLRKELVEAVHHGHGRTMIDFLGEMPVDIDMRLRAVGSLHIASANTTPVTLVTPSDEEDQAVFAAHLVDLAVPAARGTTPYFSKSWQW
jgi:hypothetical protein